MLAKGKADAVAGASEVRRQPLQSLRAAASTQAAYMQTSVWLWGSLGER